MIFSVAGSSESNCIRDWRGCGLGKSYMTEQKQKGRIADQPARQMLRTNSFFILIVGIFVLLSSGAPISGQIVHPGYSSGSTMQKHYDAAEHFQSSGDLEQASFQYELFLADALHHLGEDHARIGEYPQGAPLFDEALKFAPNDSALRLDYAEAALTAKDFPKAKLLAEEILNVDLKRSKTVQSSKVYMILGQALLGMNENEQAKTQFATAVSIDPNYLDRYALATACLALSDKSCAARLFAEMLARYGDSAAVHMDFGRAYGEADDPEEAIPEFKKAIAKDARFPDAHYCLGASYLLRSGDTDFPEAETEFRKELEIHPNDYYSYSQLGYIEMSQHKLPKAVKDLSRAATLDPQNPDNFLLLGQIYADLDRTSDAEAALRSAIAVTTNPSRNHYQIRGAHYQLGLLLVQNGALAEGKKEMEIAAALLLQNRLLDQANLTGKPYIRPSLKKESVVAPIGMAAETAMKQFEERIGPAVADSYNNLGVIAAIDKDYAGAAGHFEQAAKWNPAMEGLDYNWGRAAFAAQQYDKALLPLTHALREHLSDTEVRSMLGVSQYMTHDYKSALQTLQSIEAHVDMVPSLAYIYAESMVQTGNLGPGIERLQTLSQGDPNNAMLYHALGKAYAASGNHQQAADALRTELRLNPSDAKGEYLLALNLIALGQKTEAQALLSDLTHAGSKDVDVYYRLGHLQLEQGDVKAAVSNLEVAEKLNPGSAALHKELAEAYSKNVQPEDAAHEIKLYQALQAQHSSVDQISKSN